MLAGRAGAISLAQGRGGGESGRAGLRSPLSRRISAKSDSPARISRIPKGFAPWLRPARSLERRKNQVRGSSFAPHCRVDGQVIMRRIPPVGMIERAHVVGPQPVHSGDASFGIDARELFHL